MESPRASRSRKIHLAGGRQLRRSTEPVPRPAARGIPSHGYFSARIGPPVARCFTSGPPTQRKMKINPIPCRRRAAGRGLPYDSLYPRIGVPVYRQSYDYTGSGNRRLAPHTRGQMLLCLLHVIIRDPMVTVTTRRCLRPFQFLFTPTPQLNGAYRPRLQDSELPARNR